MTASVGCKEGAGGSLFHPNVEAQAYVNNVGPWFLVRLG